MENFDFEINNIKNLVFDVGGILVGYRWEDMFADHGVDEETALKIGKGFFESDNWSLYDSGIITTKQLLDGFCEQFPELSEEATWFLDNAIQMRVKRPRVYEKLNTLKAKGYKIYILSNYSKDLFEIHTGDLPFRKITDGEMVSYMVGAVKPDRKIYEELINRFELDPVETVFFDDRLDNIEGAKKHGIKGIHIEEQDEDLLISYLDRFL